MANTLKPFYINLNDLSYLLAQVGFVPLFDGPANSNGIVNFDSTTMDAWDANGNLVWDWETQSGLYKGKAVVPNSVAVLGSNQIHVSDLGTGFPQVSAPIGIRDVSGLHNNLFGDQAFWGTVDVPFLRVVDADYDNYVTSPGANYLPGAGTGIGGLDVVDFMPRIISRTITTGGVNLLIDSNPLSPNYKHFLNWDEVRFESAPTVFASATTPQQIADYYYRKAILDANVDLTQDSNGKYLTLVEGAKIVAPGGLSIAWDPAIDNASMQYGTLLAFVAALGVGDTLYGPAGVLLQDGMAVYYKVGPANQPQYIAVGVNFNASLAIYHSLVVESGISTAGLAAGDAIKVTTSDITDAIAAVVTAFGGTVAQATANALVDQDSGYGLLETLGHIDFQNPTSGEFFIGSENPGVAPVNSWFGIFGQFFDHGLDKLGAGGNGKITISLETTDPLYRAPGTNGPLDQGNTKITVTRATIDNKYVLNAAGEKMDGHDTAHTIMQTDGTTVALDSLGNKVTTAGLDGKWGTADDIVSLGADGKLAGGDDVNAPQTAAYINHTSPFIDQSQTYGSHEQLTNLLRKWVSTDGGDTYHAGMELFDGTTLVDAWERRWPDGTSTPVHDTLPTLSELRNHVADTKRDELTWDDVSDLRNRDADGDVIAGNSGSPLLLDMNPLFDAAHLASTQEVGATLGDTVAARVAAAVTTLNANIASTITSTFGSLNPGRTTGTDSLTQNPEGTLKLHLGAALTIPAGTSTTTIPAGDYGGANAMMLWVDFSSFAIMSPPPSVGSPLPDIHAAVGEILMASVGDHYIAGDGRVNENFGLTSIHHVFHEEHNYQVENLKTWIYAHDDNNPGATAAALHEQLHNWQDSVATKTADTLAVGVLVKNANGTAGVKGAAGTHYEDTTGNYVYANGGVAWNADKMFEATKLVVEMEYQHAAVDQYARTITPRIQEFVGYSTGVDSTISLEYAQVAFRFGHSTIRETIDTLDPSGWMLGSVTRYALEKAFLNPQGYADEGVAAITLGLSRQQMNEVDEFITPALNQGLLGQPLDLASINIARGRDMGIPTLNDFREGISLARYTSWADFGKNMFHPESLVNFIAAYSFGGDVELAEAAMLNSDFMNNTGTKPTGSDGFNHIDSWIGGLAEAHVPGGLLGETFDAIFVAQIQSLMDGDRFYYLYRLFGTNLHEEVNNGQFKDIVERNTGLTHLNGSIFAYADKYYDFGREADNTEYTGNETMVGNAAYHAATGDDAKHLYADLINASGNTKGIFSDGGDSTAANGNTISVVGSDFIRPDVTLDYIRDTRVNANPDLVHPLEGTPTDGADSHEVIVATDNVDYIHARGGDDTVYGEGGDDFIFGDGGIDRLYGGDGNDMLDSGEGPDLVDGGAGKDIIYGRGSGSEVGGFDQLVGGSGNDLIIGGEGIDKLSGGSGDDIIYGDGLTNPEMGNTDAFTHGGDGNDYIDTGASGDLLFGEEGDDYMVGGIDQDLMQGGDGEDILRPGGPSQASGTNGGPDEVVGDDGVTNGGFDLIDLSDWVGNAPGTVIDFSTQNNPLVAIDQTSPFPAWFQIEGAIGTKNGDTFIGDSSNVGGANVTAANETDGNNWLIGGSGNDVFTGNGGNDLIVGGSVRLDAMIGKYSDAGTALNVTLGSTEWLSQAMATASGGTGYNKNTEDDYTGASNRTADGGGTTPATDGNTSGGLLRGVNANIAGTANDYALHFTDMLKSRMFKDVVLGDNGVDGTADTAVFTGASSKYSMVAYRADGGVVTNPHANWASVYAIRVTDNRVAADFLDAGGNPLLDANGNPLVSDGSDLIVGVENFKFADKTVAARAYFDAAPEVDLNFVPVAASDNFDGQGQSYTRGLGWNGSWTETNDVSGASSGDIQDSNDRISFGSSIDGNEAISRAVNLSSSGTATLNFDYTMSDLEDGKNIRVEAWNATTNSWGTLGSFLGSGTGVTQSGNISFALATAQISAASQIRFRAEGIWSNNNGADGFTIDNVAIFTPNGAYDGAAGTSNTVAYTEQQAIAPAITILSRITDPDVIDTTIASAKIVLQNAVAGDVLAVGTLAGGITATGNGTGTGGLTGATQITLTGVANHAAYQAALQAITFSNSGEDPTSHGTNTSRRIAVTVNDGLKDSAVATTTVAVTGVDDPARALVADRVVTNIGTGGSNIAIPTWTLGANDADDDGVVISSVGGANGLTISGTGLSGGNVVVQDTASNGGSFTYSSGAVAPATVTVVQDTNGTLSGSNNSEIIIGNGSDSNIDAQNGNDIVLAGDGNDTVSGGSGNDNIYGGTGDDTIDAGADNDIIVWTAANTGGGGNGGGTTDGTDIVNGGTEGTVGDRFVLNGNNQNETFRILAITDPNNSAEIDNLLNTLGVTLNPQSDILITRTTSGGGGGGGGGAQTSIVAELRDIEEISINNLAVSTGGGNTGGQGADTVQIVGDFSGTSLALNTIEIYDADGGDTVDISGLTSEHRIVFHSDANGHVIGPVRPQDVVDGTYGNTPASPPPATATGGDDSDDDNTDTDGLGGQQGSGTTTTGDATGSGAPATSAPSEPVVGTDGNDVLRGTNGDNVISAGNGNDLVFGGTGQTDVTSGDGNDIVFGGEGNDRLFGGTGNDQVFGEEGNDRIWGDDGNDMLEGGDGDDSIFAGDGNDVVEGGSGTDKAYGGAGNDIFVAGAGDGAGDHYYGEDGNDTLDLSLITARLSVDLRPTGALGFGSVTTDGQIDTISGIENVVLGSNADSVTASNDANHISGGAGDDTFAFRSSAAANGDRIADFETGDVIDLRFIDSVGGGGDNDFTMSIAQSFNASGQPVFTATGQLLVHFDAANQETVLLGNTGGGLDAEFKIVLEGGNHIDDLMKPGAVLGII